MDISVIGSGYVGTTIAASFDDHRHEVVNVDIDDEIVATINAGESPIYKDGLGDLMEAHA